MKRLLLALAVLAGLAATAFGLALAAATRPFDPPATVPGYRQAQLEVAHRDVPLSVHVWYPATQGTPQLIGQNALFYGHHVRPDAPLPGQAPVVVLSHGSGGNAVQLGWLAAHLANRGYLVIAANHPGTTSRDSLPARTVMVWERTADLTALLDWIDSGGLPGFAVAGGVTAAGFSLGGHTALAAGGLRVSKAAFIAYCDRNAGKVDCGWMQASGVDFTTIDATRYEADLSDPRVTRVIAIDPALPQAATEDSLAAMALPVQVVNLGEPDTIPEAMRADGIAARMPQARHVAVPGAAHFSALPRCSWLGVAVIGLAGDDNICSDRGLRPRDEVQQDILARIDAFLPPATPH
ncbi:alpha/beta hydrolase family protein [Maliponia aquimaris]|uniref:Alpha/beta hydrolase family protein n=1 Tax=Maliponia aquimaris TaxID=1673631 RepID=A0A238K662_9RHOB|nr:CocE/NonD family hydrolase [Maliponia aquimaris]SMX38315.1 Alpha/beta hydrolase family protein [Maliponia aquimaris]